MKIILTFFAVLFSSLVLGQPLQQIVVFGDSLSDNGNLYELMDRQLPISPPYYYGRFTNGPVWVEHLTDFYYPAAKINHLQNYAYGGAGILPEEEEDPDSVIFTLNREINDYLKDHDNKANQNDLYIIWIGSNNYLSLPDDLEKTLDMVDHGLESGMNALVQHGAKNIMVVNLPDLGTTPSARDFEAVEVLTYLSNQHNRNLQRLVTKFENLHPEVNWILMDINEAFADVLKNPAENGFTNVTNTCYESMIEYSALNNPMIGMTALMRPKASKDACEGYLFFDPVHPSGPAHRIMALKTKELLDKKGVQFG